MSDGTILVLEKATVGTSHQFERQRKQSFTDLINGNWSRKYNASAFSPGEAIVGIPRSWSFAAKAVYDDKTVWEVEDAYAFRDPEASFYLNAIPGRDK
jgi:hypothetical protein